MTVTIENHAALQAGLKSKMDHLARLLASMARNPDDMETCLEAGRICWQLGEIRRAVSLFRKACRRFPENWEAVRHLAGALAAWQKPGQARRLCLEYLKNHPGCRAAVDLLLALENDNDRPEKEIDLDGFLGAEQTFVEIVSRALLPCGSSAQQLQQWHTLYQRQGSPTKILAAIANSDQFKKQAVSWFVGGNAALFIHKNKLLWKRRPLPQPAGSHPGYILTSFLHPDPTNKVRNGLVAKYLESKFGCPVLALGLDEHYRKLHRQLADSFAMEDYLHLEPEMQGANASAGPKGLHGADLRKQVRETTMEGLPVGDLIYDQYLRRSRRPTIERYDRDLAWHFRRAAALVSAFKRLFRSREISFVVVDHLVYLRWGILARMALAMGATVISHHGRSSPVYARIHRPGNGLPLFEAMYQPRHFQRLFTACGKQMAERGYEIVRRYYQEKKPHKHTLVDGTNYRLYDRNGLLEQLGLSPGKPVVFIMAHTMTDAPHAMGRLLFDDYHHWLKTTLEMAAQIQSVNWVVKEHPFATVYTGRNDSLEMATPYAAAYTNIGCCPADFHPGGLMDCADALVTARGTAGLEAAVFGKPCVLAGKSAYSGHGFTVEPATVQDYRRQLQALSSPRALPAAAVMRARAYAYLFLEACRIPCSLLPEQPLVNLDPLPDDIQWRHMVELIDRFEPARDPLYLKLMAALDSEMPYLLDLQEIISPYPQEEDPRHDQG